MKTTLTERNGNGHAVGPAEPFVESMTFSPRFDIWENEDAITLIGDMPGVMAENVDIRYENGQLFLHGKVCPRHNDIEFSYGEYGIGDYQRSFTVGDSIDADNISAEFKHGVLTVCLPKSEQAKPRKIEVKSD